MYHVNNWELDATPNIRTGFGTDKAAGSGLSYGYFTQWFI